MGQSIPLISKDRSISPKYRLSDWQSAMDSDDWKLRIAIFRDRISGRFLKPIALIEEDKNNESTLKTTENTKYTKFVSDMINQCPNRSGLEAKSFKSRLKIGNFAEFAIMVLDNLLIETLNEFYQGLDETTPKPEEQFWKYFFDSDLAQYQH